MKVLIACEFSGIVRDAFAARGHDAWSCDLLPGEGYGKHIQGDVTEIVKAIIMDRPSPKWDLVIAHPPCTHLAVCGAPSFPEKIKNGSQQLAIDFFMMFAHLPVPRIAIENPISIMSSKWRKPDQIVQPAYFGDNDSKKICLWLKNLPPLVYGELFGQLQPSYKVFRSKKTKSGFSLYSNIHESSKSGHDRSRFFPGVAKAMAEQWG